MPRRLGRMASDAANTAARPRPPMPMAARPRPRPVAAASAPRDAGERW